MCNVPEGVKSSSKPGTSSANPANPVTVGELLEPDNLDSALNANDGEICRFRDAMSVEEVCNKSSACEDFSVSSELHAKSRASNAIGRVSSPIENRRILPSWSRKLRDPTTAVTSKGQILLGQKRAFEGIEEEFGSSTKRIHALQADDHTTFILVEANNQLHQEQ